MNTMSASIHFPCGAVRRVKNLGWLLRNWKSAESIEFFYAPSGAWDGVLRVNLHDGRRFESEFASLSVCASWFGRPVFVGLPFVVHASGRDVVHKCGEYPCKLSWNGSYQEHIAACLGKSTCRAPLTRATFQQACDTEAAR